MSLYPHILGFWTNDPEKGMLFGHHENNQPTNKTPRKQEITSDYTNMNLCGILLILEYDTSK